MSLTRKGPASHRGRKCGLSAASVASDANLHGEISSFEFCYDSNPPFIVIFHSDHLNDPICIIYYFLENVKSTSEVIYIIDQVRNLHDRSISKQSVRTIFAKNDTCSSCSRLHQYVFVIDSREGIHAACTEESLVAAYELFHTPFRHGDLCTHLSCHFLHSAWHSTHGRRSAADR